LKSTAGLSLLDPKTGLKRNSESTDEVYNQLV
jgi:hypothetical protein